MIFLDRRRDGREERERETDRQTDMDVRGIRSRWRDWNVAMGMRGSDSSLFTPFRIALT